MLFLKVNCFATEYALIVWKWKKPDAVLFLACERSIAEHRYLTRKLEGRLDDDKELSKRRYDEFESLNPPVVDYYENLGLLKQVSISTGYT